MILDRITLRELRLQLREPFRISSGVVTERRVFLVEMVDAVSGESEWSECVAGEWPNYSPETIDTAWWAITNWLAPKLLGQSLDDPALVAAVLNAGVKGHAMARAALEMGVWALTAKVRGMPLARLLGGTRDRVVTGISLGIQDTPAALVDRAIAARDAGYAKIKLKIAPGRDIAFVGAVREALGAGAHIMADANSAYRLIDADHLAALDAFNLIMIEQPLGSDDLIRHATLQRRMATPICLDESITTLDRAEDMITLGAGRIVNIKPGRVGGFAASRAIHDHCARNDVPVWCGGMLESGVGRAHNVALASLPNFTLPGDLSPSARYWTQDIVEPEWTMDGDGMVRVPLDRPGIGVTVALDRVDALTVRCEVLRAS
jgi:O-succinylbenzoate synthase